MKPVELAARPRPRPGEALDGYLERVATANTLTRADLGHLITVGQPEATTAFLPLVVNPATRQRISDLTGQPAELVSGMTLAGLPEGRPLLIGDLDPLCPASLRREQPQGWFPPKGTQVCPRCLADSGTWLLRWRLPHLPICLHHGTYLITRCPTCGLAPRSVRFSAFKGQLEIPRVCGNPTGTKTSCTHDLSHLPSTTATKEHQRVISAIDAAVNGTAPVVLGEHHTAGDYLLDVRRLAVLLLHLAGERDADPSRQRQSWFDGVRAADLTRRGQRGPRWGMTPPESPPVRVEALAAAHRILTAPDLDAATVEFAPWLELTPTTPDGPLGWLADHTRMTKTLTRVVMATYAPRRRLSRRLDATPDPVVPLNAIPQQLPEALYAEHLAPLVNVGAEVGRVFGSLCLARRHPRVPTWEESAYCLGLPPDLGPRTVRTVNQRTTTTPERIEAAIDDLAARLDHRLDWCEREEAVITQASTVRTWLLDWAAEYRPGLRLSSAPYVITWRWIHEAGGILQTSPAWPEPPSRRQRAGYRQFATAVMGLSRKSSSDTTPQSPARGSPMDRIREEVARSSRRAS